MKSAGNLNDQHAALRRAAHNRSRSDTAAAAASSSHHQDDRRPHQQHQQQHRYNRRHNNTKRPWVTCRWLGPTRKRMKEWGSQLRQFFVGELPASLSLRTKIRIVLEARMLGHLWMIYQIVMTLVSCAYFAITSAYKRDAAGLFIEEMFFGGSVLADLLLRFYASDHRKWFFFEKRAIIDILSIIPVLSDIVHVFITGATPATGFDAPTFLRVVQIFKLIRILRVFHVGRQFSSPAIRQLIILILAIICIVYISAFLLNMAEGIPFGTALYFCVVTMATVGYGDVTVASGLGRFFVSCLICVSFIWVPFEVNSLTQMLSLRSRYLTTFTPRADKPNVLLIGHLDAAKLSIFLAEFFHPDRRTAESQAAFYHVVILDNEEPDDELIEVLESPLIESRVTFIKGTIMDEDDLIRAGANTAVACFIFSDGLAADTEAADATTVLRVLVLKTFRPVLPCYVQLHHSHNRVQLHMLKKQRLVCIEDLKMSIMGLSALYPGFTTLLTNLLKSSVDQVADPRWPDWQKEYIQGGQLEIYMVQLPESFSGLRFDKAARDLYAQFNGRVSLLGVEERELRIKGADDYIGAHSPNSSKHYVKRILINPGRKYRIIVDPPVLETWGYILARDRHTAELLQTLEINKERHIPTSPTSERRNPPSSSSTKQPDASSIAGYNASAAAASSPILSKSLLGLPLDDDDGVIGGEEEVLQEMPDSGQEWQVSPCLLHDVGAAAGTTTATSTSSTTNNNGTKPGGGGGLATALSSSLSFSDRTTSNSNNKVSFHLPGGSAAVSSSSLSSSFNSSSQQSMSVDGLSHLEGARMTTALGRGASAGEVGVTVVDDVRTMEGIENHIVVLLPKAVDKINYLLRPLRAHFLQGTPYCKSVVILTDGNLQHLQKHCQNLEIMTDTSRVGDPISALPFDIYVVEGQPHKAGDLRRAGIETAYTCVVLADRSCVQEIDEEAVDEYMIHQFITIEKLRSRMESHLRRPLNYVVEVLSCPTLKILDQTYKTFKGKAKRHRRHRTQGHFSDLRDRLSMLRNSSPLRGAMSRSPQRDNNNNSRSPQSVSPMAAVADSLLQQQKQQQSPQQSPQQSSQQQRRRQQLQRRGTEVDTPTSGDGGGGGASTMGVDFGVSHAAMYPFVTAGTSFLIDVFDIISCQLFYNSDLIRFVNLLLALDHHSDPAAGASGGGGGARVTAAGSKVAGGAVPGRKTVQIHLDDDDDSDDHDMNKFAVSGRLGRIPVPSELMGQEYGDLFELLMMDFEAIPIALYRHDSKADVSYVFTGPPPKTKLRMTDSVFFLAPVHTIKNLLAKYGPI